MTDQIEEQDVELDEATDVVDEAMAPTTKGKMEEPDHTEDDGMKKTDPKAQTKKAAGGTAKAKAGDISGQEPMQKLQAGYGMMNAKYHKEHMENLTKLASLGAETVNALYQKAFDGELGLVETTEEVADYNFDEDLAALVNSDNNLSEEFKGKAQTIFEAAVNSKLMEKAEDMELVTATLIAEKVEELEEQYNSEISEAVLKAREELVEKVDGYLNYVVETWMEENRLAVEAGLRTEITETFMNSLKDLFVESYIEVPESKVDLVDELSEQVGALEEKLNQKTATVIEQRASMEKMERNAIIASASKNLADTQVEKLMKLAESIDFESTEVFTNKVNTLIESYFSDKAEVEAPVEPTMSSITEEVHSDENEVEVPSGRMEQYLTAIRNNTN